jgi:hypothetical protein
MADSAPLHIVLLGVSFKNGKLSLTGERMLIVKGESTAAYIDI